MTTPDQRPESSAAIADAIALWTTRRDRGLSAAEAVEFELWLAADERHSAAFREAAKAWSALDRIPDSFGARALAGATRQRRRRERVRRCTVLAAAAVVVVGAGLALREALPSRDPAPVVAASATDLPRAFSLSDGSIVRLNVASEVVERFVDGERTVRLVRGSAHFAVTKDPARPFVVHAAGVAVRAVGTAFGVSLQSATVEVLVTEGVVQLHPAAGGEDGARGADAALPLLDSGHRAVLALRPVSPETAVVIAPVSHEEIARALAWREPLLRLGGATLAEIAADFSRRSGRRVVFDEPSLEEVRVGGRVPADDVEGFASLLGTMLDVEIVSESDGSLRLRKKTSRSH